MSGAIPPSLPAEEAVERLLDQHGGRIYGLGLRMCGRPEEAEELVQETFLRAFRKWHQFEGRSEASTWLYSIAARVCQRRHRRRAGEPARLQSLEDLLPSAGEAVPELAEEGQALERLLERERLEVVEQAVAALPAPFRLTLVLKELHELSVAEVARILNLKEATVKTRLHRGRLLLAKSLSRGLARREAHAPSDGGAQRICLDLLQAKQEALDRGVSFPVPREDLCARCRSLFASLDLAQDACQALARDELPPQVRTALMDVIHSQPSRGSRRQPPKPRPSHR